MTIEKVFSAGWQTHRSHFMGAVNMRDFGKVLIILFAMALLAACSGDSFTASSSGAAATPETGGGTTGDTDIVVNAASLSLHVSAQEIRSDGTDITTVTATVLDEDNAAINGVLVNFSADAGKLSASAAYTNETGDAIVEFSSGTADPSNLTATITANITGVDPVSIPVTITGSTLELVYDNKNLLIDTNQTQVTETIQVIAKDAGNQFVYNTPIVFSVTGTAGATISAAQVYTNTQGTAEVTLTATQSGTATLTAQGLGTVVVQQDCAISNVAVDNPFRITSPSDSPTPAIATGSTIDIKVAAESITTVRFATTIGTFDGGTQTIDVAVVNGVATATLRSNLGDLGFATVHVSDKDDPTTFDIVNVAMSPPVADAAQIMIQSDVETLPPSTDTTEYTANLEAKVVTDDASGNYPIYNVPVSFTISNATGGNEALSTGFGTTDINGVVKSKFTSGITATGQNGVLITATVVGTAISDTYTMEIGGTAGSVAIGTPRVIGQLDENTSVNEYIMSLTVADGTGAGVPGAEVTLHLWPDIYYSGVWYDDDVSFDTQDWKVWVTGSFANEDIDEDLILDDPSSITGLSEDLNEDGELTPGNSVAGVVPSTVTTLADGTAPFIYTYLKDYAPWMVVRARGTTKVLGTETTGTRYFTPSVLKIEVDEGRIADSPFSLPVHGYANQYAFPIYVAVANFAGADVWTVPVAPFDTGSTSYSAEKGAIESTTDSNGNPILAYRISNNFSSGNIYRDTITVREAFGRSAQFPIRVIVR
jgi:hypothetical protein